MTRQRRKGDAINKLLASTGLLWLAAGFVIGVGIVGYFAGLLLVPVGVWLITLARRHRSPDAWLLLSGLGLGVAMLLLDEYQRFTQHGCIPDTSGDLTQGPDCGSDYVWGFRIGLLMVVAGIIVSVAARLRRQPVRIEGGA